MSKPNPTPATSRRRVLSGSIAAALGAAVAAPAVAAAAGPNSDAKLIRLCGEFVSLEQQRYGLNSDVVPGSAAEDAFESALAQAYASWMEPSDLIDAPGDYIEDRLATALVRGLVANMPGRA